MGSDSEARFSPYCRQGSLFSQARCGEVHRDRLGTLRPMMRDRRLADPERFAHIRVELGIERRKPKLLNRNARMRVMPAVRVKLHNGRNREVQAAAL